MDKLNTIAHKTHKTNIWFFLALLITMVFVSILGKAQSPGNLGTSLAFWVKANASAYSDAGTTLCADGSTVQQWNDYSGNTRNAAQATAANKPTYKNNSTDNVNYNPVISFNGSAQSMASSDYMTMSTNSCLSTGNNSYAVYIVVRPGNYAAGAMPGKILASGACSGANDEFLSFDLRATYAVNDSWDNHDNITTNNRYTADQPILLSFIYKNTVTKRRESFINGSSVIFTSGAGVGANRNNLNTSNTIGCQLSCANEFYNGTIGEIASYTVDHTAAQKAQVESYLAIKYGITLGGNGGTSNYVNSSGTNIWTGSATYNNDIIVVGKETATEGLDQKKSVTSNGTVAVPNDIMVLANGGVAGSFASPVSMDNDGDYLVAGRTSGAISPLTTITYTHANSIFANQTARVWRMQKTGTPSGNLIIEMDMSRVAGPSGTLGDGDNNKLAMLLDNDATFGNASAIELKTLPTYSSAKGGKVYFTIPYSSIPVTTFFTLAFAASPLPVELISFNAFQKDKNIEIQWKTATETNNSHFLIKKSSDGIHFDQLAIISGAGNTSLVKAYQYTDNNSKPGVAYYQLFQVDFDGKQQLVRTAIAMTNNSNFNSRIKVFPQPVYTGVINYELSSDISYSSVVELYNVSGQLVKREAINLNEGVNNKYIDINDMENGVYFIRYLAANDSYQQEKVIVLK